MEKNKTQEELLMIEIEKLIYKTASKFKRTEKDDLIQAGWLGFKKAYLNYKGDMGAKFSTYAYNYIFGEMYALSISNNDLKINKDILRVCKLIEEARQSLTQTDGKAPSNADIALYLELPEETIYLAEIATMQMISLDESIDEENKSNLHEFIADDSYIVLDDSIDLRNSIAKLDKEEQKIIEYRYLKDYTQSETAKVLGINQAKVSRYENRSLKKMRDYIAA